MRSSVKRISWMVSQEGVTAIEFAIVAPVLCLLVFGIIEFSLIMLVGNIMESATVISSRLGKTGYTDVGVTREDTILNSVKSHAGVLIDPSLLTVTSKFYKTFNTINDPEPYVDKNGNSTYDSGEPFTDVNGNGKWDADMGTAGYGGPEDVVVYSVSYPWPISTPIIRDLIGDGHGNFVITSHAVVKNEPYNE